LKDVQRSQFLFSCSSLTPVLGQRKELWDRIWRSRLVKHEVVITQTSDCLQTFLCWILILWTYGLQIGPFWFELEG
jgi:hypothetical protein